MRLLSSDFCFNQNDSFASSHFFAEQASIPFDDFMKMTVSNV